MAGKTSQIQFVGKKNPQGDTIMQEIQGSNNPSNLNWDSYYLV